MPPLHAHGKRPWSWTPRGEDQSLKEPLSDVHARVFCLTSVWVALPVTEALRNGRHLLALCLAFTMAASQRYWWLRWHDQPCQLWHNLDRLGVVLVLVQVHCIWWPALGVLFLVGAEYQRPRVQTRVWGGGAGKEAIEIWPLWAQRRHFQYHALCRYVGFLASCEASGHSMLPVNVGLCTFLYLVHIVVAVGVKRVTIAW